MYLKKKVENRKYFTQSIYLLHPINGFSLRSSSVKPHSPMHASSHPAMRKKQITETRIGNNTTVKTAV